MTLYIQSCVLVSPLRQSERGCQSAVINETGGHLNAIPLRQNENFGDLSPAKPQACDDFPLKESPPNPLLPLSGTLDCCAALHCVCSFTCVVSGMTMHSLPTLLLAQAGREIRRIRIGKSRKKGEAHNEAGNAGTVDGRQNTSPDVGLDY